LRLAGQRIDRESDAARKFLRLFQRLDREAPWKLDAGTMVAEFDSETLTMVERVGEPMIAWLTNLLEAARSERGLTARLTSAAEEPEELESSERPPQVIDPPVQPEIPSGPADAASDDEPQPLLFDDLPPVEPEPEKVSVLVHFASEEDIEAFGKLIGFPVSTKTRRLPWPLDDLFPHREKGAAAQVEDRAS
jgi:hypothetical protein